LLRAAFRQARRERPFAIEAVVVLPDHLHCIWTLPPGDADYSYRCV
jgi:putative transposase